ncbi:MAG: hypothetical protein Q9192_008902 [Flavoplaca navasiana]
MHGIQNHLIETASSSTGSMLIWDTGEYSILPYQADQKQHQTDQELSDSSAEENCNQPSTMPASEKLHQAFKNRKIRIRLHGTRLPPNYTLSMRLLTSNNRHEQPKKPVRKRRRRDDDPKSPHHDERATTPKTSSDEEDPVQDDRSANSIVAENTNMTNPKIIVESKNKKTNMSASQTPTPEPRIPSIRYINADGTFPWIVMHPVSCRWPTAMERVDGREGEMKMGRDHERSVVTGRTADEVMEDEGVEGFTGRKGWRAVLE